MHKCPNCDFEIQDDAMTECPNCFYNFKKRTIIADSETQPPVKEKSPQKAIESGSGVLFYILGVIEFIVGIVIGIMVLSNPVAGFGLIITSIITAAAFVGLGNAQNDIHKLQNDVEELQDKIDKLEK